MINPTLLRFLHHSIFLFSIFLILINLTFIFKTVQNPHYGEEHSRRGKVARLDIFRENMTIDDVIGLNDYYNSHNLELLGDCVKRNPDTHPRWCDYEGGGRRMKVALLGNSYTWNHHKMIIQECRHQARNFTMHSEEGCEPLAATNLFPKCEKKLDEFVEFVARQKPHYAFILSRFYAVAEPFKNNQIDLENDEIYLQMRAQLRRFLPMIRKKLYILDAIPRVNGENIRMIARDLKDGKSPEEIQKTLYTPDGYERGRLRHAALQKECFGKCEIIDYLSLLTQNYTVLPRFFDEFGISYFTNLGHLSAHGIELVRPLYREICDNLVEK